MAKCEFSFSKYGEICSFFQIRKGPSTIGTGFCFWVVGCTRRAFCLRLCRFVCSKDGWLGGGCVGGEEQQRLN
jgi:hypothetical protein